MHPITVLLLLLLSSLPLSLTATAPSDVAALRSLKSLVSPSSIPPWSCLASWNFSSDPCRPADPTHFLCALTCSPSGRVLALSLDPAGYLADLRRLDLSPLTSLSLLNLAGNAFRGPIPTSLPNLQTLILSSNSFSSQIPPSLSNLSSLQTLDLSRNFLSGPIPDSLCNLRSLRTLDLSYNQLSGDLPRRLPPNLVQLVLRGNSLSGTLRKSTISPLKYLQVLDLGANSFRGGVEGWLLLLPSLQQFNVANNSIQWLQVSSPRAESGLVAVDLGFNNISGGVPAELADFEWLAALTLRHNRLTGSIPWQYAGAKKGLAFRRLFLDGNFLNGNVPEGFFGGESEVVGSFGDNCLLDCPETAALCSPAQKPDLVCKQVYGAHQ